MLGQKKLRVARRFKNQANDESNDASTNGSPSVERQPGQ